MPKLSVHLVTYNGAKYIPYLFDSLRKQAFRDWELLVIDNHSTDDTVERVRKELAAFPIAAQVVVNTENQGFAGGHNQAFARTNSELVLVLNQDMYLQHDCLQRLVAFMDAHADAAAATPRLMRWDFDSSVRGLDKSFTNQIDSLGLEVRRSRRVTEMGVGREWHEETHDFEQIFGVSGAAALFRRHSLEPIMLPDGALFDPLYLNYKEDVDLAFRLCSHADTSYVVFGAVAYHDRTGVGPKDSSDFAAARNKAQQSKMIRHHSYRNHLMTLYKNEYWQNVLLDFPWIMWYELKKFIYLLFLHPAVLAGFGEIWRSRAELRRKRLKIKSVRQASWQDVRKWW